ncbi:mediator of RNA polymerase II transcription subunit 17-like [Dysidea avara]|uniref:mediator of RNA polymerase II transcription subunit 17-like n=1 Tax=Dysidea avara TaxID=196820 RepID=UPI00332B193D
MASSFKVSVEPLATARIKQINYEGEEIYQERPTSSQLLTELVQRVDFSAVENKDDSETGPPAKKSVDRWPWEETHSKLKQALMEVNVLADLLRMAQDHKHYVMLDPVLQEPRTVKSSYQLYIKKKAIAAAADILQEGAKNLNAFLGVSNSDHFHKALLEMRKGWKLRRTNTGIVGDLNYYSGRVSHLPSTFGVHKGDSDQGTIVITVPRDNKSILLYADNRS